VLQTFCEGPNNGGPSIAKFHEGPDPRILAGSTPMSFIRHFRHQCERRDYTQSSNRTTSGLNAVYLDSCLSAEYL